MGRSQVLCLPSLEQQQVTNRVKSIKSDPTVPEFKSQLCHLLAIWSCEVTYSFGGAPVFSFVMGMIIVPAYTCIKGATVFEGIGKMPGIQ